MKPKIKPFLGISLIFISIFGIALVTGIEQVTSEKSIIERIIDYNESLIDIACEYGAECPLPDALDLENLDY